MGFLTASYWQAVPNYSSLLLQHYSFKGTPLCLMLLCGGEGEPQGRAGAYLTGQALCWFRDLMSRGRLLRRLLRRTEDGMDVVRAEIGGLLDRLQGEIISYGLLDSPLTYSGIFCCDDRFLLMSGGNGKIFIINRGNRGGTVKCLAADRDWDNENAPFEMKYGVLQSGVGILLSTDTFAELANKDEIADCLPVWELHSPERLKRRLGELGLMAQERGGKNMAAGLLVTRDGGSQC